MTENQQKIYFIEVLRGIALLLVVGYHAAGPLVNAYASFPMLGLDIFRNGNIGVDIFFMISGFIICYATQKVETRPLLSFVIRRFFRIYPLFLFCLLFVWFSYSSWKPASEFIKSAFLLHSNYSLRAPFFGYNMLYPAWTISYEILFYSIFLIGMAFSHKWRALITSLIILTSMLAIQLHFKSSISVSGDFSAYSVEMGAFAPVFTMLGSPMLLEFILGMFLFFVFRTFGEIKNNAIKFTMISTSVAGIYLLIHINTKLHGFTDKGLIAAFIFISMMIAEMSGAKMSFRITRFFSNISYSLYLTHSIVLSLSLMYIKSIGYTEYPKGFLFFALLMGTCILISYFSHIFIEKPFILLGKRLLINITRKKI